MKKLILPLSLLSALVVGGCLMCPEPVASADGPAYVETFDLSAASCGMDKAVTARVSVDGHPLTVCGKTYEHGFGARPESAVGFFANGRVTAFDALVGIDDDSRTASAYGGYGQPAAEFRVWADGRIVWSSGPVKFNQKPVAVHVDLTGAREIALETRGGGAWTATHRTNGDWLDARFTCAEGAKLEANADKDAVRQLGILTPPEKPEPQINGADVWGVRPGHPVLFRVATSGERPMTFTAKNLPAGVTLDPSKGILGGVAPKKAGNYDIEVTATNTRGAATRTIRLAVGETIALTPPMGWNSWNTLCYRLTAEKAKAAARAMEASGLGDHGWSYINLDDWWEMNNSGCDRVAKRQADLGTEDVIGPARDVKGKIQTNRAFPDMRGLTDYIHGFGFKAGLYSSPGAETCGRCEGSLGHELLDAESFADWGFDYLKYDWCSYNKVFKKETGWTWREWVNRDPAAPMAKGQRAVTAEDYIRPYRLMGECLRKQKRDIVYSLCQYGMGNVETWGRGIGANCFRSWDDLKDGWAWMEIAIDSRINGDYWKYTGPGFWGDPDMMIVGQQFSFGHDHETFLTPNEQYTHVSVWAMVSSPMLTGCDLAKLSPFTRSLLVNDEVIAISQDRLGRPARRIRHLDAESVWVRELSNGDKAVALVNRYPFAREIRVTFTELGLGDAEYFVRDCWSQTCEGRHAGTYVVEVPAHATKLVRIRSVGCPKCE